MRGDSASASSRIRGAHTPRADPRPADVNWIWPLLGISRRRWPSSADGGRVCKICQFVLFPASAAADRVSRPPIAGGAPIVRPSRRPKRPEAAAASWRRPSGARLHPSARRRIDHSGFINSIALALALALARPAGSDRPTERPTGRATLALAAGGPRVRFRHSDQLWPARSQHPSAIHHPRGRRAAELRPTGAEPDPRGAAETESSRERAGAN